MKKPKPYISPFDTDWSNAVSYWNGKPKANQDHFNWLHHRNAFLNCDRTTECGQAMARQAYHDMLDSVTLENPPPRPTPEDKSKGFRTFLGSYLVAVSLLVIIGCLLGAWFVAMMTGIGMILFMTVYLITICQEV